MPRRVLLPKRSPRKRSCLRFHSGHPADQQGSAGRQESVAERIVYGALEGVEKKTGSDPVATLKKAMDNIKPSLEVRSRRVGGATYQVPVEFAPPFHRSGSSLARWLLEAAPRRP